MGHQSTSACGVFLFMITSTLISGCTTSLMLGEYRRNYASPVTEMRITEDLRVVPVTLYESDEDSQNGESSESESSENHQGTVQRPQLCLHEVLYKPGTCLLIGEVGNDEVYAAFIGEQETTGSTGELHQGLLVDRKSPSQYTEEWQATFNSARVNLDTDVVLAFSPDYAGAINMAIYSEEDDEWLRLYIAKENIDISHYKRSYFKQGILIVAIPFAFAFDVVTSPVQAVLLYQGLKQL